MGWRDDGTEIRARFSVGDLEQGAAAIVIGRAGVRGHVPTNTTGYYVSMPASLRLLISGASELDYWWLAIVAALLHDEAKTKVPIRLKLDT